ncbi:hypothetical protein BJY00DRAFT_9389 [Aspergillus carlsbadensis]|nr:hypothetical protein BJY00DRAFT_9389 [Aspergillus carlsbadensis]
MYIIGLRIHLLCIQTTKTLTPTPPIAIAIAKLNAPRNQSSSPIPGILVSSLELSRGPPSELMQASAEVDKHTLPSGLEAQRRADLDLQRERGINLLTVCRLDWASFACESALGRLQLHLQLHLSLNFHRTTHLALACFTNANSSQDPRSKQDPNKIHQE